MLKKRLAEMEEAKLLQTSTEGDTQSAAQPQSDVQLARAKAVRPHTRRLEFSEPPVHQSLEISIQAPDTRFGCRQTHRTPVPGSAVGALA
jgi:hypothetical protein